MSGSNADSILPTFDNGDRIRSPVWVHSPCVKVGNQTEVNPYPLLPGVLEDTRTNPIGEERYDLSRLAAATFEVAMSANSITPPGVWWFWRRFEPASLTYKVRALTNYATEPELGAKPQLFSYPARDNAFACHSYWSH